MRNTSEKRQKQKTSSNLSHYSEIEAKRLG